jgi:hypothetical protein
MTDPTVTMFAVLWCVFLVLFVTRYHLQRNEVAPVEPDATPRLSPAEEADQERYRELARHQDRLAADARSNGMPELAAIQEDLASTYRDIAHSFTKEVS